MKIDSHHDESPTPIHQSMLKGTPAARQIVIFEHLLCFAFASISLCYFSFILCACLSFFSSHIVENQFFPKQASSLFFLRRKKIEIGCLTRVSKREMFRSLCELDNILLLDGQLYAVHTHISMSSFSIRCFWLWVIAFSNFSSLLRFSSSCFDSFLHVVSVCSLHTINLSFAIFPAKRELGRAIIIHRLQPFVENVPAREKGGRERKKPPEKLKSHTRAGANKKREACRLLNCSQSEPYKRQ